MEFIDHTGHFFTQKSYNEYPTAYEFETLPYVFWLNAQYTKNLSIDNYYMLPIRPLIEKERYGEIKSISIKSQSNIFKLVASQRIQNELNNQNKSNEKKSLTIELSENSNDLKDELDKDDILLIKDDKFIMLPFYIIGNSQYEGTFTTTILIHISFEDNIELYCPITIGGAWVDEIEQLQINAANMGVNLPKDIIKAVYQGSLVNDKLDTALYNDKVKEYLINYMTIKGECGNTNSVLNSLKWFGYGDKITIDKLLRTDNDLFTQYVHDNLSLKNDIIESFEHFVNTSLFTLVIKENEDLDNIPFKFKTKDSAGENNSETDFWGENNPETMSLFDKLVEAKYDEEKITFYKPYYEFTLQEMFLKLSCLKYYYQKYFLPLHVGIYSASIQHKEYCNDIKFTIKPFNAICANLTILNDADVKVKFPEDNNIYLYNQIHYVDDLYNEFTDYEKLGNETDMSIYYTDDICFSIPIKITGDEYYRCKILLARNDNKVIYESSFNFAQSKKHDYKSLVILPKIINKLDNINYWLNYTYVLYICVNDKWFEYPFTLNIPKLNISFGTLEYKYDSEREKQTQSVKNFTETITENNSNLSSDEINKIIRNFITEKNSSIYNVVFNAYMYLPYLVSVNNINFCKNVVDYTTKENLLSFISKYRELPNISSSEKYYNRVHYFDLYEVNDKQIDVQIKYENKKQLIGDLYRDFFDEEGNLKNIFDEYTSSNYDFYLMHDSENPEYYKGILPDSVLDNWTPHWYVVFISKQTIDKANLLIEDSFTINSNNKTYKLKHVASDNKFLINRMTLKDSGGVNIFNTDDIIVSTINNIDMPFILELGSRWNFKPFSLGMNKEANVYSNTNSAIISMGKGNIKYECGYYDVNVRYSLDGNTQEQITKRARILVK